MMYQSNTTNLYYVFYYCTRASFVVTFETGELFVNFRLAYLGITFLTRHCLLKQMFAQHFSSLDLVFL